MNKKEFAKMQQRIREQKMLSNLSYELEMINHPDWHVGVEELSFMAVKCRHCNTVFNYIDFDDGECPFCYKSYSKSEQDK